MNNFTGKSLFFLNHFPTKMSDDEQRPQMCKRCHIAPCVMNKQGKYLSLCQEHLDQQGAYDQKRRQKRKAEKMEKTEKKEESRHDKEKREIQEAKQLAAKKIMMEERKITQCNSITNKAKSNIEDINTDLKKSLHKMEANSIARSCVDLMLERWWSIVQEREKSQNFMQDREKIVNQLYNFWSATDDTTYATEERNSDTDKIKATKTATELKIVVDSLRVVRSKLVSV
jgi:hypothetical protein